MPWLLHFSMLSSFQKQVAICKCQAHTNNDDFISQGNARADTAAKAAAQLDNTNNNIQCLAMSPLTSTADLLDLQARASLEERVGWEEKSRLLFFLTKCGTGQMVDHVYPNAYFLM